MRHAVEHALLEALDVDLDEIELGEPHLAGDRVERAQRQRLALCSVEHDVAVARRGAEVALVIAAVDEVHLAVVTPDAELGAARVGEPVRGDRRLEAVEHPRRLDADDVGLGHEFVHQRRGAADVGADVDDPRSRLQGVREERNEKPMLEMDFDIAEIGIAFVAADLKGLARHADLFRDDHGLSPLLCAVTRACRRSCRTPSRGHPGTAAGSRGSRST